MREVRHHL